MSKKVHIGNHGTPSCARGISAHRVGGSRPSVTVTREAFADLASERQCQRCAKLVKREGAPLSPAAAGRARPDRGFFAELAQKWGVVMPCLRLWRSDDVMSRDAVLKASPMWESTYATLFTYMYRRFGIPPLPGDDYKDLCGGWLLTTPSPSLLVLVSPSLSGPDFSFEPMYVLGAEKPGLRDILELKLPQAEVDSLRKAYQVFLRDMLRPVCIRDAHINALGRVDDDSPLLRANAEGYGIYEAHRHSSAGYGVPTGLVGCKDWPALTQLIGQAGDGDVIKGSAAVVAQLRASVLADAAAQPVAVKRLIILGAWEDRQQVGASLGFPADELALLLEEARLFWGGIEQAGDGARARLDAILDDTTEAVVATACDYLTRLAYDVDGLSQLVKRAMMDRSLTQAWAELVESGEGEFPFETIPSETLCAQAEQQALRANFEAGGHVLLSAWLERTLLLRHGGQVLPWILMQLRYQMRVGKTESAL